MPATVHYPTTEGRASLAKRKINSSLAAQLRQAILGSGLSISELSRQCGVDLAVLSRFMRNERTLTLPIASRICDHLGLRLCSEGEEPKGKRKK